MGIIEIDGYIFEFTPLEYIEYLNYSWDKNNPRFMNLVCRAHVIRCIDLSGEETTFKVENFEYSPGVIIRLVDAIYKESDYEKLMSPEELKKQLLIMGTYTRTKEGMYDILIFHYLGLDGWKLSRESYETRLKLISLVQETTGVVLEERWEEMIRENKPIDITIRDSSEKGKEQKIKKGYEEKLSATGHSPEIAQQLADHLQNEIHRQKKEGKKKHYNWQNDVHEESNISKDTREWNS